MLAVEQGLNAAMWRWTAARLRNRPQLESWPVSLHVAHTKRVSLSVRVAAWLSSESGPAGTLAQLAMSATAVSKRVQTDHVIAYPVYTR